MSDRPGIASLSLIGIYTPMSVLIKLCIFPFNSSFIWYIALGFFLSAFSILHFSTFSLIAQVWHHFTIISFSACKHFCVSNELLFDAFAVFFYILSKWLFSGLAWINRELIILYTFKIKLDGLETGSQVQFQSQNLILISFSVINANKNTVRKWFFLFEM